VFTRSFPQFPRRVDITYVDSKLEPKQLQAIFEANLPLLLEIFNPQGWCVAGDAGDVRETRVRKRVCSELTWRHATHTRARLELTYVDEALRVGRDDKGDVFVLERVAAGAEA
jgi:hypothetical protein